MVLMASVTSLPELVTGISSVTYAHVPDIAVGDVLGSCVFNLLILAVLDAFHRQVPICSKAHQGHVISGGFGTLLLCIVAVGLLAGESIPPLGWIGPYSLLFAVIYFMAMKLVFLYERQQISAYLKEVAVEPKYKDITTRTTFVRYGINAAIVIIAAILLPKIGESIAETTGLGQTFVGNIFIAISTSLPELVVSIAAVKMGAIDLAIGNLLGSNLFNILVLAIDDLFFTAGPLLSFAHKGHIASALSAIAMTTIAIICLTYRATKKKLFLAWDSIALSVAYVINIMLLYVLR